MAQTKVLPQVTTPEQNPLQTLLMIRSFCDQPTTSAIQRMNSHEQLKEDDSIMIFDPADALE